MPMRSVARRFMAATRAFCFGGDGEARQRIGDTCGGWKDLNTVVAAISTMLGLASLAESMPFLISRMAFTSSTRPLSQLLLTIRRLVPGGDGNLGGLGAEIFDGHAGHAA